MYHREQQEIMLDVELEDIIDELMQDLDNAIDKLLDEENNNGK